MIVLDAANKSLMLILSNPGSNVAVFTSVVSYWSIDTSNMWIPSSFEVKSPTITVADTTILPPPVAGEVSRVVENVWINLLTDFAGASHSLRILLDVGGLQHAIGKITRGIDISDSTAGFTFTIGRDGLLSRQRDQHSSTTVGVNENIR